MNNYPTFSTENDCCVCPDALLAVGLGDVQSLHAQSPIQLPQNDEIIGANPDVTWAWANEHGTNYASSDSMSNGFQETNSPQSPESLIYQDMLQAAHSEASSPPSITQFAIPELRDLAVATKPKSSSSLHKALSIRSLQRRLAGKAGSDTIDHIQSVLRFSTSNSWRSSIASFASSWKSRGSSLLHRQSVMDDAGTSEEPMLSSYEQMSWDELVDETKLAPPAKSRPIHQEISLSLRPCCRAVDDFDEGFSCSTCGFSSAHYNGRNCVEVISQGFGTYIFSCSMDCTDRFGNTPLHFAAASTCITIAALKKIITSGVNIKARNTSGENFMHVLNVTGLGSIAEYIDLLKFLKDIDFRFTDRDIHGRTIAHRFFEGLMLWKLSIDHLEEIFRLLRVDVSAVDNLGYDFGLSDLISNWRLAPGNPNDKRNLLLRRHHNLGYLKVDYRATLLSLLNRRVHSLLGNIDLLGLEDWLSMIKSKSLIKWVDINGDTPLTALVKYYPELGGEEMFRTMIRCLVSDGCDINARDREGYTALAIATRRGLRPILSCLLDLGASVNTRSYHGTSTMNNAAKSLHRARKSRNEKLYGMIISCISFITDRGAKTEPSIYDEFSIV